MLHKLHKPLTVLTLAFALGLGVFDSQAAAVAQAPMAAMFVPGSTTLTPAGERWLDTQLSQKAARTSKLLIVKLPGEATTLQIRRAQALRERLVAHGVPTEKLFFEAGGA